MTISCVDILQGFTHSGVFHADDVFSAALLQILNPRITIIRGSKVPDGFDGVVFDIGGGEFDHHSAEQRLRENGMPYASFGLLWARFGCFLLLEDEAMEFDEAFIQPLDLADNNGSSCQLAMLVSDFNPQPPACESEFDESFLKAVEWARGVLERRFLVIRSCRADNGFVREAMKACDGDVLVLSRYAHWVTAVAGSNYRYVVYPSIRGGYCLQAVDEAHHFPCEWRGLATDSLVRVSGVPSLVFCHPSGFMCCVNNLEDVAEVIRQSDSMKGQ